MSDIKEVPEPRGLPILGHAVGWIDNENPIASFVSMAGQYGEIYRLRMLGIPVTFCSQHELINELCDEKRFRKVPAGVMKELRTAANDGLITAHLDEENWGIAHRILMPAFGQAAIRDMFNDMQDIASQLAMKWARMCKNEAFTPSEDFTRLAMDTLALCSMDYRFNSFYNSETHPFLQAMARVLTTSRHRARRGTSALVNMYYRTETLQYFEDISYLRKLADDLVSARTDNPAERKDLVDAMLNGIDSETGKRMTAKSITDNALSFLVAGHETTAGLLAFTLYYMTKYYEVYRKAQREVDEVIGEGRINVVHLSKLPYITAILREVLRLEPPLPVFAVKPYEEIIIGSKYRINKNESCVVLLQKAQRDPEVYGEDADQFRPERMLDGYFEKLPPGSFKPFGNGQRACIGRYFALQEATLMLAMLLQNFDIVLDNPEYELEYIATLTMKPKDFKVRAHLRKGITPTSLQNRLSGGMNVPSVNGIHPTVAGDAAVPGGKPLTILYGSNGGTCESLAQLLAAHAPPHGFTATTVDSLDSARARLPSDHPVAIVTTSYDGQPTDDARKFVYWLEDTAAVADSLSGTRYALFGLGNRDWVSTFHKIPKLIDAQLEKAGAKRLVPLSLNDVGSCEIFSAFEMWEDEVFWPHLQKSYSTSDAVQPDAQEPRLTVDLFNPEALARRHHVSQAKLLKTRALTDSGEPLKKHLEIQLPKNMTYRAGDYLAVLPVNPRQTILRVTRRLLVSEGSKLAADHEKHLLSGHLVALSDILESHVELGQPATKRGISALMAATEDSKTKGELQKLGSCLYDTDIVARNTSILDLLERFPEVNLSITSYLSLLTPMRLRQYSISSSPLWKSDTATLTFSVLDVPSTSHDGRHIGVASSYLDGLRSGQSLSVAIRPAHEAAHLPTDAASTSIVMIAAGSGIAPFRGFIQERAHQMKSGEKVAPALLFYGCREPGRDDLYSAELVAWEEAGAVRVSHAYSRTPAKAKGQKYVQNALWVERDAILRLWQDGARFYICGSREMGRNVTDVMVKMHLEAAQKLGEQKTEQEVRTWWESLRNVRYVTEVFD